MAAAAAVPAKAGPSLRVRGAALIEGSATAQDSQVELKGALRDDTGRPIGAAHLRVRLLEKPGGAPLPLPAAEACPPSPLLHEARNFAGQPDEYVIDTSEGGAFCVRLPGDVTGTFQISFTDTGGLYDPTERIVPLDRARAGVELVFATPPSSIPLEAAQNLLTLEVRMRPLPELRPALPIQVSIANREWSTNIAARAGEATPIAVPRSALLQPGPIELNARYVGAELYQPGETRLRTTVTARVELGVVGKPNPAKSSDGIALQVAVGSIAGAVPSGSVEARLGAETVGIARVDHGVANIIARFEVPRRSSVPLTLVYLPAEPWWLPSAPVDVVVEALPASSWGRAGWFVALVAVAAWLLTGWWRPRRILRQTDRAAEKPTLPAPGIQVLEAMNPESGWKGKVIDAHERHPIPKAAVALVRRGFDGEKVLQRVQAGEDGSFELEPLADRGGVWLVVEATWHSSLEKPLPPAGRLSIEMMTRRRQLIGRFVAWAERRGRPWADLGEPTPGHVANVAGRERKDDVKEWARAVEAAAFGPTPVDEDVERNVVAKEPRA
ncbi:MAG TPA: hypothetical protein VM686_41780 [Polyangiaceae bacterium]|nr:hypothetical protein [Polyangiaceae bacterium]